MVLVNPSWSAWWEANRDPYIEAVRQDFGQVPDANVVAKSRKQAVDSLWKALKAESSAMRSSAALALAQMGEQDALGALAELAKKDKEPLVRQAAILAIGLLDMPEGEAILAEFAFAPLPRFENGWRDNPTERQAAFVAMGLMSKLSAETLGKMQKMGQAPQNPLTSHARARKIENPAFGLLPYTMTPLPAWSLTRPLDPRDPAAPKYTEWSSGINGNREQLSEGSYLAALAAATWAMSFQDDLAVAGVARDALGKTNVPWIASEAMLALGSRGGKEAVGGLSHILLATPTGEALAVNKLLAEQHQSFEEIWKVRRSEPVRKAFRDVEKIGTWNSRNGSAAFLAYFDAIYVIYPMRGIDLGMTPRASQEAWYRNRYLQHHFGGDNCDAYSVFYDPNRKKYAVYEFSWMQWIPGTGKYDPEDICTYKARVNLGVEPIVMANLRASASVALGRIDSDESNAALWRVLNEKVTSKKDPGDRRLDVKHFDNFDYSVLYKSQAIMSLGLLGDEKSVPILVAILKPAPPVAARGVAVSRAQRDAYNEQLNGPLRAFAALALGLYARPTLPPPLPRREYVDTQEPDDPTPIERKHADNIAKLLADIMKDRKEPEDLRAACALALALMGRSQNLIYFKDAGKSVDKSNELLLGYMTLARAMLGDRDKALLDTARPFLSVKNNRTDRNGILARRAVAMGIGLTGSPQAIPTLTDALSLGRHVTRESALALSFCGGHKSAADKLLAGLNNPKANPQDRALLARCLGDLFAAERPSRLTRLSADTNYDMRIPRLTTYRAFANEFLFTYLLAPPPDEWQTLCPE